MPASYHNHTCRHTCRSDGSECVAATVEAARQLGIDEFGISDHHTLSPDGTTPAWSMPPDHLPEYVREVQAVAAATHSVALRLGLEADFFPETVDELRRRLAAHRFDFVIGSVHFVGRFPVDTDAGLWQGLSTHERDEVWRDYWRLVRRLAESGVFDMRAAWRSHQERRCVNRSRAASRDTTAWPTGRTLPSSATGTAKGPVPTTCGACLGLEQAPASTSTAAPACTSGPSRQQDATCSAWTAPPISCAWLPGRAGAGRLPFPDARFDTVLSTYLHTDIDDIAPVFAEIARVLRH